MNTYQLIPISFSGLIEEGRPVLFSVNGKLPGQPAIFHFIYPGFQFATTATTQIANGPRQDLSGYRTPVCGNLTGHSPAPCNP